jgi:hypothetical protein
MEEKAELQRKLIQVLNILVQLKFQYLLEELRKQLLEACIHFEIYINTWPTKENVDVINRYRGYFIPARLAHINQFTIKISEILSNRITAPSFYNVFKMLKINPEFSPGIAIQSLSKTLRQHTKTKEAIINYRNISAAHSDVVPGIVGIISLNEERKERKPILVGKCQKMLDDLKEIFNKISLHSTRKLWSFTPLEHYHTDNLLNHLNIYHEHKR